MQGKYKNLTGKKFGKLEVIGRRGSDSRGNSMWKVKCECGFVNILRANALTKTNNPTRKCRSCIRRTHGCARNNKDMDYLYRTWSHIKGRCRNENDASFKNYGGRGIKLFVGWNGFIPFMKYIHENLGERPIKHSIDRINNDGDYEPGNVKWSTQEEQANNKRNNRVITINDETKTFNQWCRERNIPSATVWNRIKSGMSPAKALNMIIMEEI